MFLFNIQLQEGHVIKRPSASCKTPYVADVNLNDQSILAHTAALGCCGLADVGARVLIEECSNKKNVCSHRILLAKIKEKKQTIVIGIDPKLAEKIVARCLELDLLTCLQNHRSFEKEKKFLNSRFDFAGYDHNGRPFILEVKNVPLADYVDCLAKEKKNMDFTDSPYNSKISYFPDGYRKKVKDTVSPRALKHIQELEEMVKEGYRCILCYVIQRTDVASFQPSNIDPIYKNAVIKAKQNGVEIITVVVHWTEHGDAYFVKDDLPINI